MTDRVKEKQGHGRALLLKKRLKERGGEPVFDNKIFDSVSE